MFQVSNNSLHGFACGDFLLRSEDNHVIAARSMEFPIPMASDVLTFNRGEKFQSTAPGNFPGVEWTSKYGYVGINAFHENNVDEGMNTEGLSAGALTLNGSQYQFISESQRPEALAMMDTLGWILGNFATVDEVQEALGSVRIWGQFIEQMGCIPGLHIALHDATGKSAVIEFLNGEAIFRENPIGVLTNEPPLPDQLLNLERYNHLMPLPPNEADYHGVKLPSAGPGNSMSGLPGGPNAEDRFVAIAKRVQCANPATCEETIETATHILNAVDVAKGIEIVELAGQKLMVTTHWSTVKDLTNRVFYYRAHNDGRLQAYDLTRVCFEPGTLHNRIAVCGSKLVFDDVTDKLKGEAPKAAEPEAAPAPGFFERFCALFNTATPQEQKEIEAILTQSQMFPNAATTTDQALVTSAPVANEEASTEQLATAPQAAQAASVPGFFERLWGSSTPQEQKEIETLLTQSQMFAKAAATTDQALATSAANVAAIDGEASAEQQVAPQTAQVEAAPAAGLMGRIFGGWFGTSATPAPESTQAQAAADTAGKVVALSTALVSTENTPEEGEAIPQAQGL